MDETTDVVSQAQLIVFCRFADTACEKITEHYLFCKPLGVETTANAIFGTLDEYIKEKGLSWEKCKSVTTDGAAAMTGSINGVVKKFKEVSPECVSIHCILHREALVAKKLKNGGSEENDFAQLLREVVGIVNYIRSHAKKRRIFSKLCEEMDASFTELLLRTEVRWLTKGKVLSRIFLLREELEFFFTEEHDQRASKFRDNFWLAKVAYMAFIFEHLNKLNVNMQGKNISIFEIMYKINAIKKKIPLWQKRVASKFFFDFSLLHDFMTEHEINFQMQLLPRIEAHLKLLEENFEKYFTAEQNATCEANSWILHPFTYDSITTEIEDLIDLQSDYGMKALFKETPYTEFWVHLLNVPEYRSIAKKAISVLIQMPTTYLCESGFSCLCEIKSRKRNSITHIDPLMRGAIETKIIPRFEMLVDDMQQQKSH